MPNLQSAYVGFGLPIFSHAHNLVELHLSCWGCRGAHSQPLPAGVLFYSHPHLVAHRDLRLAIGFARKLKVLEFTHARPCNDLLAGYMYADVVNPAQPVPNPVVRVEPPLSHVMGNALGGHLTHFTMRSAFYAQGQHQGQWFYRGFYDNLYGWDVYQHLEMIETECWFFFLGRPAPVPGTPVVLSHPDITNRDILLPRSIRTIKIMNLCEDYVRQFYHWVMLIWQTKQQSDQVQPGQQARLPQLTKIVYSTLLDGEPWPPAHTRNDLATTTRMLAQEGIELVRVFE